MLITSNDTKHTAELTTTDIIEAGYMVDAMTRTCAGGPFDFKFVASPAGGSTGVYATFTVHPEMLDDAKHALIVALMEALARSYAC